MAYEPISLVEPQPSDVEVKAGTELSVEAAQGRGEPAFGVAPVAVLWRGCSHGM